MKTKQINFPAPPSKISLVLLVTLLALVEPYAAIREEAFTYANAIGAWLASCALLFSIRIVWWLFSGR